MSTKPLISVVMPVYNAEKYLRDSVESILEQTYKNFEFIIIDDGSTDKSAAIIKSYKDPRIIFKSRKNKGQTATLNEGMMLATGEYLARQDADDISASERFEKQIQFLTNNPEVALLGTNYNVVNEGGELWFTTSLFTDSNDLKKALVFSNQLGHGTVMIKKDILQEVGVYDESINISQDYDLWSRISHKYHVANLKEPLYIWRYYAESLSTGNPEKTQKEFWNVRDREFEYFIANKKSFRYSFRPFSINPGLKRYCEMKNGMLRDMSLLYGYRQQWFGALRAALLSVIVAPWKKESYRLLYTLVLKKSAVSTLRYESSF